MKRSPGTEEGENEQIRVLFKDLREGNIDKALRDLSGMEFSPDNDLDLYRQDGETLVMLAAKIKDARVVKALLDKGASPDNNKISIRHIRGGVLISKISPERAPYYHKINREYTPLMLAVRHGNPETVKALLERGADPNEVCYIGTMKTITALTVAVETRNAEALNYLLKTLANTNKLPVPDCSELLILAVDSTPQVLQTLIAADRIMKQSALSALKPPKDRHGFEDLPVAKREVLYLVAAGADSKNLKPNFIMRRLFLKDYKKEFLSRVDIVREVCREKKVPTKKEKVTTEYDEIFILKKLKEDLIAKRMDEIKVNLVIAEVVDKGIFRKTTEHHKLSAISPGTDHLQENYRFALLSEQDNWFVNRAIISHIYGVGLVGDSHKFSSAGAGAASGVVNEDPIASTRELPQGAGVGVFGGEEAKVVRELPQGAGVGVLGDKEVEVAALSLPKTTPLLLRERDPTTLGNAQAGTRGGLEQQ